jgi:hypothetical protein
MHTRDNRHNKILLTRQTSIPETIDTTRYYSQDKQAYQRQRTQQDTTHMTNRHTRDNRHNKILLTRQTCIPETIDTTRYYSQDKHAYQRQ